MEAQRKLKLRALHRQTLPILPAGSFAYNNVTVPLLSRGTDVFISADEFKDAVNASNRLSWQDGFRSETIFDHTTKQRYHITRVNRAMSEIKEQLDSRERDKFWKLVDAGTVIQNTI